MDWLGDLWGYPFWADVWGNAAEWTAALLTGGAFMIAALVYRRDSTAARDAQAKLILAHILSEPVGDDVVVGVDNYSLNSVFRPKIEVRRMHLWDAITEDKYEAILTEPDPSKEGVRNLVSEVAESLGSPLRRKPVIYDAASDRLRAGEALDFRIKRESRYDTVFLTFIDSRGRNWEVGNLASPQPRIRHIKKKSGRRGAVSRVLYRMRHPWKAQKEFRTRWKIFWRALWVTISGEFAKIFGDELERQLNDPEFKRQLREQTNAVVARTIEEMRKKRAAERQEAESKPTNGEPKEGP